MVKSSFVLFLSTTIILVFLVFRSSPFLFRFQPFCISSTSSYFSMLVLVQAGYQFNKVTWETHLLHGSPKLRMADTIKGFAVIYKAQIERMFVFPTLFDDISDVHNMVSDPSSFSKTCLFIWNLLLRLHSHSLDDDLQKHFACMANEACGSMVGTFL